MRTICKLVNITPAPSVTPPFTGGTLCDYGNVMTGTAANGCFLPFVTVLARAVTVGKDYRATRNPLCSVALREIGTVVTVFFDFCPLEKRYSSSHLYIYILDKYIYIYMYNNARARG
jgi:hypothetical protein